MKLPGGQSRIWQMETGYGGIMEQRNYTVFRYLFPQAESRCFRAGKYYAIYYLTRGYGLFEEAGRRKSCGAGDMVIVKPGEQMTMCFRGGNYLSELLEVRVLPAYLKELSDDGTDLEQGFSFVPFKTAVIHAESQEFMLIRNIAAKLTGMEEDAYGHCLYEKNLVSILLILSLRACVDVDKVHLSRKRKNVLMDDIFVYIREHLAEELTLERLEKEFYVSRYHICREFKRLTGQTPHSYIVKARLDLCRKYIAQGKPIREVYQLGGFGGYNHFFRAFKKEYGVTPREYYRKLQSG